MNFIGNILWLVFGGFFSALGYFIVGLALCFTFIGIPWGLQCFKIAGLVLWPFGKKVVYRQNAHGCFATLFNIIWLFSGGLYTACIHLVFGILFAITIIGLPFARQHFKLLEISMMPFGKDVVYE